MSKYCWVSDLLSASNVTKKFKGKGSFMENDFDFQIKFSNPVLSCHERSGKIWHFLQLLGRVFIYSDIPVENSFECSSSAEIKLRQKRHRKIGVSYYSKTRRSLWQKEREKIEVNQDFFRNFSLSFSFRLLYLMVASPSSYSFSVCQFLLLLLFFAIHIPNNFFLLLSLSFLP